MGLAVGAVAIFPCAAGLCSFPLARYSPLLFVSLSFLTLPFFIFLFSFFPAFPDY